VATGGRRLGQWHPEDVGDRVAPSEYRGRRDMSLPGFKNSLEPGQILLIG